VDASLYILEVQGEASFDDGREEYGKRLVDAGPQQSHKMTPDRTLSGAPFTQIDPRER